jgi:hypothetical protein
MEKWGLSGKKIVPREREKGSTYSEETTWILEMYLYSHIDPDKEVFPSTEVNICSLGKRISMYLYEVDNSCIGSSLFFSVL